MFLLCLSGFSGFQSGSGPQKGSKLIALLFRTDAQRFIF
jgi:hypothetical protein